MVDGALGLDKMLKGTGMKRNILGLIVAIVWITACLTVNHIYNLTGGHSETISIAFSTVMIGGGFVIGHLTIRKK
jgi:hypothetical protein